MTKTAIKIGDPVIINDIDAPQTNNIALVRNIEKDGTVRARYLWRERRESYGAKDCYSKDRATHLIDFGVQLRLERDATGKAVAFTSDVIGDSVATYPDGKPRKWQCRTRLASFSIDIKNPMLPAIN